MAGLLQAVQPQQAPAQDPQQQAQELGNPAKAYEELVSRIATSIYDPTTVKAMKQVFERDNIPNDQAVGLIVSNVIGAVMAKGGDRLKSRVMMRLILETLNMVMELAVEGGYISPQEGDAASKQAFMFAMEQLGQRSQDMAPEKRHEYAQMIQGLGGL